PLSLHVQEPKVLTHLIRAPNHVKNSFDCPSVLKNRNLVSRGPSPSIMQRYINSARPGEVRPLLQQRSDLPRCALFKVATHLFKGRSVPSSKEGNRPFFHILPFIHTFEAAGEGKKSNPHPALRATFSPREKDSRRRFRLLFVDHPGRETLQEL